MRTLICVAPGCGFRISERFVSVTTMIICWGTRQFEKCEMNGWLPIAEERLMTLCSKGCSVGLNDS